jgi:transcription termination factor Rho
MFIEITIENIDSTVTTKIVKQSSITEIWKPESYQKGTSMVIGGSVHHVSQSYGFLKKQLNIR